VKIVQTSLPGVVIIEPAVHEDERGWFMESFNEPHFHEALKDSGLPVPPAFIQDNHSCSRKGVLRGLHYQRAPEGQGQLVRVTKGSVYNVVVDIRRNSPMFGHWMSVELNATNHRMLWTPEGFAHGFVVLEEDTHFLSKTTSLYNKDAERSIRWNDPEIGIEWPVEDYVIAHNDAIAPLLKYTEPYSEFLEGTIELVDLKVIGDDRGSLIALEQGQNIPFAIKRAYYIFDTRPDVNRGFHAHRRLEQLAICVSGRCKMVIDDGVNREEIWLDSSSKALIIRNMIWREMRDFSTGCVLVVFASEHYDESDYIRNYDQFIKEVNDGKA
jgi:dTDP-4-dehydrorhamnose 3,5-epimerase